MEDTETPKTPKRRKTTPIDTLDPNRVIAFNLRKARDQKHWSQKKAAEMLEPHIGGKWSVANWSSAERSISAEPSRVRNFTVSDVYAFARTFELSFLWFLIPPLPGEAAPAPDLPEPDALDLFVIEPDAAFNNRHSLLMFNYYGLAEELDAIRTANVKKVRDRDRMDLKRDLKRARRGRAQILHRDDPSRSVEQWERVLSHGEEAESDAEQ